MFRNGNAKLKLTIQQNKLNIFRIHRFFFLSGCYKQPIAKKDFSSISYAVAMMSAGFTYERKLYFI